jgi:hypothetical protein
VTRAFILGTRSLEGLRKALLGGGRKGAMSAMSRDCCTVYRSFAKGNQGEIQQSRLARLRGIPGTGRTWWRAGRSAGTARPG